MHRRTLAAIALTSILGFVAFTWPLLAQPGSGAVAHAGDAPLVVALMLPLLLVVLFSEISSGGLDSKAVAMLAVLAAVGAASRTLGAGIAGLEPIWLVILLGGRVFGRGFGFVLGAVTVLSSALLTGGIGPWLPFQMMGAAWVGFGAGCLPTSLRGRLEVRMLALYGALAAFCYGALLNLWFWPWAAGVDTALSYLPGAPAVDNLQRWLGFTIATSLGWDLGRAVTTAVLILIAGAPALRALRRAARRAAFDAPVEFRAAPDRAASASEVPAGTAG